MGELIIRVLSRFAMCKSQACTAGKGDLLAVGGNRLALEGRCMLSHLVKAVTDSILLD